MLGFGGGVWGGGDLRAEGGEAGGVFGVEAGELGVDAPLDVEF